MKIALAALSALVLAGSFSAPAVARDRLYIDEPVQTDVRDGGWREGRHWGERDRRWSDRDDDALSERQIVRRLMRQGFVEIEDIDRRRDRYVVRAARPNGALVRLVVDAYDGRIIDRERIGWVSDRGGWDRGARPATNGVEFDLGTGRIGFYAR